MTNMDVVAGTLRRERLALCDACLLALTGITPVPQINQIVHKLVAGGVARRDEFGVCGRCQRPRRCTYAVDAAQDEAPISTGPVRTPLDDRLDEQPLTSQGPASPAERPWHWEGHVQSAVERWLVRSGWMIRQSVDTASRRQGIDLIASNGERELWVTVKGFPSQTLRTVAPTQARHWFSHAMFDVILYRQQSERVEIAVALPDPFATYRNNAARVAWFQRVSGLAFLWVDRHGGVAESRLDGAPIGLNENAD